ncbi:MAG: 1-phosphofructokinase [Candidatus Tectimicrobiota bacterium]
MIYTVTLNPALDRTLEVEHLHWDEVNRVTREVRYAGGKGIDVSRALKELGWKSVALGFIGGYDGHEVAGRLGEEGVICRFTPITNETRTNIIVHDRSQGGVTALNAQGPEIAPHELASFLQHLDYLFPPPTYLVCSGSIPPGVPTDIYRRLIDWARPRGVKVVLDADGAALREGIAAAPFAIKPNRRELSRLIGKEVSTVQEAAASVRELYNGGIEVVLVSLGPDGMVGLSAEGAYHAMPPRVEVSSPVGAGDSAVAGFLAAQLQGYGLAEALRLATAAGTAAVLTSGTELCRRDDVERLERQVSVTPIG